MHTPRIEQWYHMITCEQERIFSISGKYTQGYSVLKAKKGTIEALQIVSFAQASFLFDIFHGSAKRSQGGNHLRKLTLSSSGPRTYFRSPDLVKRMTFVLQF